MIRVTSTPPVAVQRCDRFVARTMNWLYDHLRFVRTHEMLVVADKLQNRSEFPELAAMAANSGSRRRAVWRRISGRDVDPVAVGRIRRRCPVLLHSHFGYVADLDYDLWRTLRIPWFIGFYGADVYANGRQPQWRDRYGRIFSAASRVLALGPVMAHHLELLGCPTEKVVVHPLGVDSGNLPFQARRHVPGGTLRVLFAGTFREKKGLQYALEGIALARRRGVTLELDVVAEGTDKPGDRETEHQAGRLVRHLGLESHVRFRPFLTFRELLALAMQCHVFVAPSVTAADGDSEGTPFVLQQMMATAMPSIATRHSDIPYIYGRLAHLLVPERSAAAISECLEAYANAPDLLLQHGTAMRNQIVQHFDARNCAARLGVHYDSVTGGRVHHDDAPIAHESLKGPT